MLLLLVWPGAVYEVLVVVLTAAGLAQSVERLTLEREVADSIPGAGPILPLPCQWLDFAWLG